MRGQILVIVLLVLLAFIIFLAVRDFSAIPKQEEVAPRAKVEEKAKSVLLKIDEEKELQRISEEISRLKDAVTSFLPLPAAEDKTPPVKSEDVYQKALSALVNTFCEDRKNNQFILGSGAVVHPKGYVLTNAHLAEIFNREGTECVLRRGSPSLPFAKARVVYLPDQSLKIGQTEIPRKDVALLKIIEGESFEYFEFDPDYKVQAGEILYSLGYPTEFLGSVLVLRGANLLFTLGAVDDLVNIDEDKFTAEGANLKGEISAQHGSSGGIFLDREKGKIVGLFIGLTEGKTTSERIQFMFLSSYLDSVLKEDKGVGILEFLDSNP